MPLKGLKGRKALVTGAASGIGQAVAKKLRAEGVEVTGTDIHQLGDLIAEADPADRIDGPALVEAELRDHADLLELLLPTM